MQDRVDVMRKMEAGKSTRLKARICREEYSATLVPAVVSNQPLNTENLIFGIEKLYPACITVSTIAVWIARCMSILTCFGCHVK